MNLNKTILLVEDDTLISRMYTTKLTSEGYTVVVATNGQQALEELERHEPDVVLLDIGLPVVDGWHVLQTIKQTPEHSGTPVILLTNMGTDDDVKRGLAMGADDYLIKAHFIPSEVVDTIKEYL